MALNTGDILHGRYRIVKLVGQGGFGAVYRAWDQSLSQQVALKENVDAGPESQRQFEVYWGESKMSPSRPHWNLEAECRGRNLVATVSDRIPARVNYNCFMTLAFVAEDQLDNFCRR